MSSRRRFTFSCCVIPPADAAPRGCSSAIARKSASACCCMKLISELGCSPKAAGVSVARCSSMYSRYCACERLGGASKRGYRGIPSSSSSRK